jgi:hypothetical protein
MNRRATTGGTSLKSVRTKLKSTKTQIMALEALLAQLASAESFGHSASSAVMRTLRSVVDELVRLLHLHATLDFFMG